MEDLNRIEYRLQYQDNDSTDVMYFDSEDDAWKFIKDKQIFTYTIVKEELIASRHDASRYAE